MDIISHGLYGGAFFGRKNKKSFWLSFLLGITPDFITFAPYFLLVLFRVIPVQNFSVEPPVRIVMPDFVYMLYNFSHSLVIFSLAFLIFWAIFRKPVWEFLAWGLHILVDIPTHSYDFFATPFLWPLSDFRINGHAWDSAVVLIPNFVALVIVYAWFWYSKKKSSQVKSL